MASIDEAGILASIVEFGAFTFEEAMDQEQVADAVCQVWQMHKHGMVGEPWVEDDAIHAELTDEGRRRYAELGLFELDDREQPIEPGEPVAPKVARDVQLAAEMLRHAATKTFPTVSKETSEVDGSFTFSAGPTVTYEAKVTRVPG